MVRMGPVLRVVPESAGRPGAAESMTLILSYCAKGYVCQVGDRLVSKRYASGKTLPHDPWFNKQVLYLARDGLFIIGFSGVGHIGNVPTDQWIASIVANEPLAAGGRRSGIGLGTELRSSSTMFPSHWLDIGRAVERLRNAIAFAFARLQQMQQRLELGAGLTIVLAGHKYKLRWRGSRVKTHHIRPVFYKLSYSEKPYPGVSLAPLDRYWGWERGDSYLDYTPELPRHFRNNILTRLRQEGSHTTDKRIEAMLVDGIREVAQDPQWGVSSDCVSVSLMPSRDPEVRIRYNPLASPYGATVQGAAAPSVYSGWIVTPGLLQEPQLFTLPLGMTKTANVHGLSIRFEGPQGEGEIAVQTTQPRKPRPRR
jgi:hypothetical protein